MRPQSMRQQKWRQQHLSENQRQQALRKPNTRQRRREQQSMRQHTLGRQGTRQQSNKQQDFRQQTPNGVGRNKLNRQSGRHKWTYKKNPPNLRQQKSDKAKNTLRLRPSSRHPGTLPVGLTTSPWSKVRSQEMFNHGLLYYHRKNLPATKRNAVLGGDTGDTLSGQSSRLEPSR